MKSSANSDRQTISTTIFLSLAIFLLLCFHLHTNNPSELIKDQKVTRVTEAHFLFSEKTDIGIESINWQQATTITLPHVWTEKSISKTGIGWYRVRFTALEGDTPNHIFIPRVGVNGRAYVNGTAFQQVGDASAEKTYRPWNRPYLTTFPDGIVKPGDNELVFELFGERAGFSGLSSVYLGQATPLFYFHAERMFMQNTFASISVGLTMFAAVSLLLIFSQFKQETYLLLLSAFFFLLSIRIANFSHFNVPKNSDAFEKSIYSLHFMIVGLSHWMTLINAGIESRKWRIAIALYTLINVGMIWLIRPELALESAAVLTLLTLPVSLAFIAYVATRDSKGQNRYVFMHIVLIVTYFALAINDWTVISLASRFEEGLVSHYLGTIAVATISLHLIQQFINIYQSDLKTRKELMATLEQRNVKIAEQVDSIVSLEKRRLIERQGRILMSEMHDGIGSVLNNLKLMLLQEEPDKETMASVIQRSLNDLRVTLVAVDPDERSLGSMLAQIRADYSRNLTNAGIHLVWQIDEQIEHIDLDPAPKLHIARIVQEAITNAVKHSGCDVISVSVIFIDSKLYITVADNGCGIPYNVDQERSNKGIGLRSMRSRANEANFTLNIESRERGEGTAVYLEVNVDER